jgi:hypothetical protein
MTTLLTIVTTIAAAVQALVAVMLWRVTARYVSLTHGLAK